jgi:hypothetical protein
VVDPGNLRHYKVRKIQCWESVTFCCGSGSGSPDPYLSLMDPDPTPDSTSFFIDFKDAKKKNFIFFSYNFLTGTSSSIFNFLPKFFDKILFCRHYISLLNTSMRKGKDLEPDPYL